jgi:hypothetical protein
VGMAPSAEKGFNMGDESDEFSSSTAATHPEEMKGTVFKLGNLATITATGRTTPAGLIGAAFLLSALLLPLAMMIRRWRCHGDWRS